MFSASTENGRVAVKLTDAALADNAELTQRMTLVSALADFDASVTPPMLVRETLVQQWGQWFITATRFVEGQAPDPSNVEHAGLMGAALADLHSSLRRLPQVPLPSMAALRAGAHGAELRHGSWQLLHGDFSASNMVLTSRGLSVFDFDDCGYGPVELDVACSVYMVLFDATVNETSGLDYERFRHAFVAGYTNQTGRTMPDDAIDEFIDLRVSALGYWLDHLSEAPIGIQASSPEWLEVLHDFVTAWPQG